MWGFLAVFLPLDSVVTAALRDFPQEMNQREEREDGKKEKRADEGWVKGVWVFNIFFWKGQSPVSFSTNRVLVHWSQGVEHKLIHCLCCCFCFLSISFGFSVPMRLTLARLDLFTLTPKQKMRLFCFSDPFNWHHSLWQTKADKLPWGLNRLEVKGSSYILKVPYCVKFTPAMFSYSSV